MFDRPGAKFFVNEGQTFTVEVPDAIDLGAYSLQVKKAELSEIQDSIVADEAGEWIRSQHYDGDSQTHLFEISLDESCTPYIELSNECDIVNWYNPYKIPEVRLPGSYLYQVIVTPLISGLNQLIGYELRMGDHKVCGSPARTRWAEIMEGKVKKPPTVPKPNTVETPMSLADLIDGTPP